MLDPLAKARQARPPLIRLMREEQGETFYAVECRLANRIVKSEELRRRLVFLDYCLEQDQYDLWTACRWAERIELCRTRLAKDRKEIRQLWLSLWQWTAEIMARGGDPTPLDRFFFQARRFLDEVLAGTLSFAEIDRGYDWEYGRFKPEFLARTGTDSAGSGAEPDSP